MEVVLDLIETSEYIYSRKAFDKCPLPVLISSTGDSRIEYVNLCYKQRFGVPASDIYVLDMVPQEALRMCRTVGKHDISIFLPENQTTFTAQGDIELEGVDTLAHWLDCIKHPVRPASLKDRAHHLRKAVDAFVHVVNPLLDEELIPQ